MIYNPKQKDNNRFVAVSIPSSRKLFERYGYSTVQGHPDNTDPYKFSTPSNVQSTSLHQLGNIHRTLEFEASQASREIAQAQESPQEVVKTDED